MTVKTDFTVIEAATEEEFAAAFSLINSSLDPLYAPLPSDQLKKFVDHGGTILLLQLDKKPIGALIFTLAEDTEKKPYAHLSHLSLLKEHRGLNYGNILTEYAFLKAKHLNLKYLNLIIAKHPSLDKTSLQKVFEDIGFGLYASTPCFEESKAFKPELKKEITLDWFYKPVI